MIFPSLEEVKGIAGRGNVIPVCKSILADTETPVSVWLKLFRNEKYSFLLESVEGQDAVARYSFLGGAPFLTFTCRGNSWTAGGESGSGDPVGALRRLFSDFRPAAVEGVPRFCGGAVGYFSYDAVRLGERIPDKNPKEDPAADIFFGFYRDVIAFDNKEHRLLLITNIMTGRDGPIEEAYRDAARRLGAMEDRMAMRLQGPLLSVRRTSDAVSNFTKEGFEAAVEKCRDYIRAGDVFQVVPSQRFTVRVEADPFDLYRILRVINPSPYMYYLAADGTHVIGASPEMLVRVENGRLEMRPIAGTRPRGKDGAEDEKLAGELLADPKERAEHVMLVDLGRNDVGRVARTGTVRVEEMMHIEKYSHVMHIVSSVSGELAEGRDAFDALFSCFPAGTLSGAPKIRAMEIIDEIEPVKRGLYGGALGYIGWNGTMDTCIVIRTIVYRDGVAIVQAGAGVVADSDPAREYQETLHKADALFAAMNRAADIAGR